MSDSTLDNSTETTDDSSVIKELRKKAEKASTFESANIQLTREIALLRAGLGELSEQRQKALAAVHDGDWNAESLKATASALGFYSEQTPPQPASDPEPKGPDPSTTSAMQRTDDVTNTDEKPKSFNTDDAILNAGSEAEIIAALKAGGVYVDGEL